MTQSSGQQTSQQQSQSSPWAPTQPWLTNILGQVGGVNGGYWSTPTPQQTSAVNSYQNAAGGLPNFGGQTADLANLFLGGVPNLNQNLQNAFQTYQSQLQPFTNQNNLNPLNTPGLGTALQYMQQQIGNNINGQFAGAGRDLSPANSQALGYGEAGALAPLIMGQYNTNAQNYLGSVGNLYQGANTLNNALLGNVGAGLQTAGAQSGFATNPALTQLAAANQGYNLPLQNVGGAESLILPIAGLGGQTQSQGQTNTSLTGSPLQGAVLGANAFGNFLNPFGGYGGQQSQVGGFGSFLNAWGL